MHLHQVYSDALVHLLLLEPCVCVYACVCKVVGLCLHYASLQFCFNGRKVAVREWPTLGIDLCLMKYKRMFLATTSSTL